MHTDARTPSKPTTPAVLAHISEDVLDNLAAEYRTQRTWDPTLTHRDFLDYRWGSKTRQMFGEPPVFAAEVNPDMAEDSDDIRVRMDVAKKRKIRRYAWAMRVLERRAQTTKNTEKLAA